MCDVWEGFVVSVWAGTHVCGRYRGNRPEGLSRETSNWGGKMLALHPECDPTTPAKVALGDRYLDRWFQGSEGKLGMLVFRWLCVVPNPRVVDGNQVESGCFGVEMLLLLCVVETVLQLTFLRLMGGACV